VAGYHVFYGTTSGSYSQELDAGNTPSAAISGLGIGRTYYFAVSAYDSSGVDSTLSNEVSFYTGGSPASGNSPTPSPRRDSSPTPTPPRTPSGSRSASAPFLDNISTRVSVGGGNNAEIVGFIIAGTGQKTIIVRALGPTLSRFGVTGVLADPRLEIHNAAGNVIASNNGWRDAQQSLFVQGGPYHAFQPTSDNEPAIVISLPPGTYTAVVTSQNGGQGVALAEVYDISKNTSSTLTNISTRGQVLTGDRVLIGGVTVGGGNNLSLVLRAIGPTLSRYGLSGALQNPHIALYNSDGTLLRSSDNWRSDPSQAAQLVNTGYAPQDWREPAMIVQLPAGNYTAVVQGVDNSTGLALFDSYALN